MLLNYKFIFSFFKYLIFLTSISIFLIFCDSDNNQYTGPWKEVLTPGGPQSRLEACYFTSSDNGWACGNSWNEEEHRSYPLLIHWNGIEWEEYPYGGWFDEEGLTGSEISDISFSGPNDGWCIGSFSDKWKEPHGFILRYDGTKWYVFQNIGVSAYNVYAISSNDVWFVIYPTWEEDSTLYHWDGNEIKKCDSSPVDAGIFDLAFSSSTQGLAVGNNYCVYGWNGTCWGLIDYNNYPNTYPFYYAVAYYEPYSALIVGEGMRGRWRDHVYQYEYNFHAWYNDIHFSHPDEGWMIGCAPDPSKPFGYGGWTWHWDGKDWIKIEEPLDMVANAVFSIDYNDAWIVGYGKDNQCWSWHYEPEK